jgi:hypothetical protein
VITWGELLYGAALSTVIAAPVFIFARRERAPKVLVPALAAHRRLVARPAGSSAVIATLVRGKARLYCFGRLWCSFGLRRGRRPRAGPQLHQDRRAPPVAGGVIRVTTTAARTVVNAAATPAMRATRRHLSVPPDDYGLTRTPRVSCVPPPLGGRAAAMLRGTI